MIKSIRRVFATRNLVSALATEISQMPSAASISDNFLETYEFKLLDRKDSALISLNRKTEGFCTEISFQGTSILELEEDEGDVIDVRVVVGKSGNTGLIVDCAVVDSEMYVNKIMYSEELAEDKNVYFSQKTSHQGLAVGSLDEDLQDAVTDYLDNLGVNKDLADFIAEYSIVKEKQLRGNWMKSIVEMLNK